MSNSNSPIDSENTPTSDTSARQFFLTEWVSRYILNGLVVWIVLTVALLLTLWVWQSAKEELARAEQAQFETRASEVSDAIVNRMGVYEQVLRGGVGLFEASDSVTRTEWKKYVANLKLDEKYPGVQGLAVSFLIPAADLDAHLSTIRAEGFPDYAIRPPGTRAEYTPVTYIEPFDLRNQSALGFDMFSEANRRAAMSRARDADRTSISAKVELVTETNNNVSAGVLMYLPYYKNGLPHDTLAQRRANLVGYVFAPFRVNDLISGIPETPSLGIGVDIDFEIFDGTAQSADSLLYDNDGIAQAQAQGADPSGSLTATRSIDLYGQTWSLYFTALPGFYSAFDENKPLIILLVGMVLSVLLSGLIWMFVTRSRRTLELANRLTGDLGDSEERWKFALEGAGDGVWDWNPQTDKALFSKRWKEMVGYAESEFPDTGAAWIEHLHPDDKDRVLTEVQEYFASNRARYSVEFRMRCKDGSWKWIMARGKLISRDSDGNPLRIIGTHTDITERIEAQEEILRLNTDLVRADGVKDAFIEDMNHELRTPLTSILGFMEVLIDDDSGVEPKFASSLKTVQRNALRLHVLIENLMYASGASMDDTRLVVSTRDVGYLLGEVVTSLQLNADHAGVEVTLRLDSPASDLLIDGDVNQLEQVFVNLVHNAIKYTPREGKVTIVARRAHTDGDYVEVTVTDTGIGISREDFPRVFERFFRASTATEASIPGFALGLSLANSIVDAHHGTITFDSSVGKGTVFTVRLPVKFIPTGPPNETT